MTIKELSKYNNLKIEVKQLEKSISELYEMVLGSPEITGMPKQKGSSKSPVECLLLKKVKLEQKLTSKQEKLLAELSKIENFLDTIDDITLRITIREKYIEGKTWSQIGKKLNFDRTTLYYKLKKFLEERIENE